MSAAPCSGAPSAVIVARIRIVSNAARARASSSPASAAARACPNIKTALEAFGCTADEMEKSESSVFAFEVDDAKCKDGEYDIKLDKDFKIIIMLRD
jgi:hypothetical protein